jgi:alpha-beta hydrolase superfamily lysophospholipase
MTEDEKTKTLTGGVKPVRANVGRAAEESFPHEAFSIVDYDDEHHEPAHDDNAPKTQVFSCPVDHDGTSVFVKCWINPHSKKPPLIIAHGLGESVSQYRSVAGVLHKLGFSVFSFDMRGHGRSGAMLGHVGDFNNLVSDILQVVSWVRFKSNRRKPFVIAQGISSLSLLYFAKKYPQYISGVIMAAPLLAENKLKVASKLCIRAMAELFPGFRLPRKLTPAFLLFGAAGTAPTHGKLGYFGITSIFAREILNALYGAYDIFKNFTVPALFLCPMKDEVCDYDAVADMIHNHPHPELFHIKKLEEKNHYLLRGEEAQVAPVIDAIVEWLDERIAADHAAESEPALDLKDAE